MQRQALSSSFASTRKDRGAILSAEAEPQGGILRPLSDPPDYSTWFVVLPRVSHDVPDLKHRDYMIRGGVKEEKGFKSVRMLLLDNSTKGTLSL